MKNILQILLITLLVCTTFAAAAPSDGSSTFIAGVDIDLINQDPDPGTAGSLVELKLAVTNNGDTTVNNLNVEILADYPFSIPSGESIVKEITTLNAYQKGDDAITLKNKILIDKNAVSGTYDLQVKYYGDDPTSYSIINVPIEIDTEEQLEILSLDTTEIAPGEEKDVVFTIKNVGKSTLENINFEFTSKDDAILPVGGDNTQHIASLQTGESTTVEYTIVADTAIVAGLNTLSLKASFEKQGGSIKEITTTAGIYIGGKTDFDVEFASESNGEISLSVANIGSNPAYSAAIKIPKQSDWIVTGSSAAIIGNLNNGDYTIVSYNLAQKNSGSPLKVQVEYTDTRGYRQSIEKQIEVSTTRTGSSDSFDKTGFKDGSDKKTTSRSPMGGMSQAISKIKTYAIYGGIILAFILVAYFTYKKLKPKGKRKK